MVSPEVADESDGPANEDRESDKGGEQTVNRNKLVLMPFLCKLKE